MKKSVIRRSGNFIQLASFFVVLLFALTEVYLLRGFNSRIETVYRNSINYSSNYWANQFYVINSELQSLIDKNDQTDFNLLCANPGADAAQVEGWKKNLQHDLTNMSIINNSQFVFFASIPQQDILLSSIYNITYLEKQEIEELKAYLETAPKNNTAYWNAVTLGGEPYFLHLYNAGGGCSGCYVSCANVLKDILPGEQGSSACILNMDGSLFYGSLTEPGGVFSYARPIRMINKKISIAIPYYNFVSSGSYITVILLVAAVAALLLIFLAILHQRGTVFDPITRLEQAMEAFSRGDTKARLQEEQVGGEIRVLYQTYNRMADQIVELKYNVYEAQLEREKTYSQFLRVQVQPHFYTNILNLIHALAGTGDYATIQELTRSIAGYFRYLLSLKEDYVLLEAELACIDQYVRVQQIRYQGHFSLDIACGVDAKREKIPPLLLQTFIENSIRHNIMIVEELRIGIGIAAEGSMLAVDIDDNGVGFSPELLARLKDNESLEESGQHIGINNIKNRLLVLFGDKASVEIGNKREGAHVRIRIPRVSVKEGQAG